VKISACVITLNEEKNLARCLQSLVPVVDEMVVVDSGSTDKTLAIAKQFKVRIIEQPWLGYVGQKNFALQQAQHPWVLSIDADEELSPDLADAIRSLDLDPATDAPGAPNGYQFSRVVHYRGQWIHHGDWYPDRLVRLFRRAEARFTGGRVHEKLELGGEHPVLPGHLHHYTYENAADRAARSAKYAQLWAETAHEQGRTAGPLTGPVHAVGRLLRGYIFKLGFLDGAAGWDVALGNAREVALKYRLLRQMNAGVGPTPTGPASPRSSKRSAAVVGVAVMGSRLMGVVREQIFAFMFGASVFADAFIAAFRIPNLLRDLFAEGALSTAFTTTFTKTWTKEGADEAWHLARLVLSALVLVLGAICLVAIAFAPEVVYVTSSSGWENQPGKFELTVQMTRLLFPFIFFVSLAAAVMASRRARARSSTSSRSSAARRWPRSLNRSRTGCIPTSAGRRFSAGAWAC